MSVHEPASLVQRDSVTVLTVTRRRPQLLFQCMASVKAQRATDVHHLVLIDDCDETDRALLTHARDLHRLSWYLRRRRPGEQSGPSHLAHLRNLMIRMANSRWVAFLDDDNTFLPEHLASLLACARDNDVPAAHSWLRIFEPDGAPYTRARWPWCRDDDEGEQLYADMVAKGVMTPGDSILRDSVDNYPARCVDTSAWLLDRAMLGQAPMESEFTYAEFVANKAEDDKLHAYLLANEVPVACTGKATLSYTLGGYSTNHDGCSDRAEVWRWSE